MKTGYGCNICGTDLNLISTGIYDIFKCPKCKKEFLGDEFYEHEDDEWK